MNEPTALQGLFIERCPPSLEYPSEMHQFVGFFGKIKEAYACVLASMTPSEIERYLGCTDPVECGRFFPFLLDNGYRGALWRSSSGEWPVVAVGYGDTDVIASDFTDFMRLFAMGYQPLLCTEFSFSDPPDDPASRDEFPVVDAYVRSKGLEIPELGAEIVDPARDSFLAEFRTWFAQVTTSG